MSSNFTPTSVPGILAANTAACTGAFAHTEFHHCTYNYCPFLDKPTCIIWSRLKELLNGCGQAGGGLTSRSGRIEWSELNFLLLQRPPGSQVLAAAEVKFLHFLKVPKPSKEPPQKKAKSEDRRFLRWYRMIPWVCWLQVCNCKPDGRLSFSFSFSSWHPCLTWSIL